jgi:hypothetical protein
MKSTFIQPAPHAAHPRHYQWQERMHHFLAARAAVPFAFGTNDCAMFVSDHIKEITGVDIAADVRGTYSTELGAAKQFAAAGGLDNHFSNIATEHGFSEIPVVYAQRGDVLFNPQDGQPALLVMDFDGIHAVGIHDNGTARIKARGNCTRAWRIA